MLVRSLLRHFRLHFKFEAIVSELHMRVAHFYQALVGFGMRQIVSDVREPRAARLELLNERERLLDGLMHGMWNIAQRVQHQFVESLQERHR